MLCILSRLLNHGVRLGGCVVGAVAMGLAACHSAVEPVAHAPAAPLSVGGAEPAVAADTAKRRVLATFEAPPYTYELAIDTLDPDEALARATTQRSDGGLRPFVIRLREGERVLDAHALFQASCGLEELEASDRVRGADPQSQGWSTTRGDHCQIDVAARLVQLAADVTGLLVTEAMGSEYRHSNHVLFTAHAAKLHRAWSYDEVASGEDHTAAIGLADERSATHDLAFVHVLRASTGEATRVSAQRLHYEPATLQLMASALPDKGASLYIAAIGSFSTVDAALDTARSCARPLDVLRNALVPGVAAPSIFVGGIYARRGDADAAAAGLASACSELPPATVLELKATHGGTHGRVD